MCLRAQGQPAQLIAAVTTTVLLLICAATVASAAQVRFPGASSIKEYKARQCLLKKFDSKFPQDKKVYSQYGEDGILEAIFSCIGVTDRYYVEFGTQNGDECSTRNLRENHNFTGLLMDGGHANAAIGLHQEFIYSYNIVELFQKYQVPMTQFDHATIDIDQNTFWVAQEVLRAGYRPRSLTIEFNRNFGWQDSYATVNMPEEMAFTEDSVACRQGCYSPPGEVFNCYFGASAKAYVTLAKAYGYHFVATDREGINVFFVHESVIGSKALFTLEDAKRIFSGGEDFPALHPQCLRMLWVKVEEGINYNSPAWRETDMPLVVLSSKPGKKNPRQRVWYEVKVNKDLFSTNLIAAVAENETGTTVVAAASTQASGPSQYESLHNSYNRYHNPGVVQNAAVGVTAPLQLWFLLPLMAASAVAGALLSRFGGLALRGKFSRAQSPARYGKMQTSV